MKLGGVTITVNNPATTTGYDRLGAPVQTVTSTTWAGCSLQEHRTSREIGTTDEVTARYRLFAPAAVPITSQTISVTIVSGAGLVDGASCLVDGEPAVWSRRTGRADHIECYIRREIT